MTRSLGSCHVITASGRSRGYRVEVPGGRLAVETFTPGAEPVLAIHGISSQRRLWNWLRAADPGLSLIAPDLRGRGGSVGVAGPSSMSRHAADMIAVLDHLGLAAVHVCGMSMGGFVAVELATAYPGRVRFLDAAIALGGTVTGEHGVGILKRDGMRRELDPGSLAMQDAVRRALDPRGIFNPGKG